MIGTTSIDRSSELAYGADEVDRVMALLGELPGRDASILRMRFGLDGEPMTFTAIGEELGVSSARVQQLERRAIAKLADGLNAAR